MPNIAQLNEIFSWFQTNDKPTQPQFENTFFSFRHKSEKIIEDDLSQDVINLLHSGGGNFYTSNGQMQETRVVDGNNNDLIFSNFNSLQLAGNELYINSADNSYAMLYVNANNLYQQMEIHGGVWAEAIRSDSNGFYFNSQNSQGDSVNERFHISTGNDIVDAYFANSNFFVFNSYWNRIFLADIDNDYVIVGDVDNANNKTQLIVNNGGRQIWLQAEYGVAIYANGNNFGDYMNNIALLSTNNIVEGASTIELPFCDNKTLAVGVNGNYANGNGMITIPTGTPIDNAASYTPTISNNINSTVTVGSSFFYYQVVGNVVSVYGKIVCQGTTTGNTKFDLSLPAGYAPTANNTGAGNGIHVSGSNTGLMTLKINAAGTATAWFYNANTGSIGEYYFNLKYSI